MPLTRSDYNSLTLKLNEVFNESAALALEEWVGKRVFDVIDTDWRIYDYLGLHGVGGAAEVAEGGELPTISSGQGDTASFTQRRIGAKVGVTKDMRMFDRYDQMEEIVRSGVDEIFAKVDQSMADLLTNGFTGSSYTDVWSGTQSNLAADGVVLFSASHTNNINSTTDRNLIRNSAGTANPGLSRDAIVKARSDARTYTDPNGVTRPIMLDTLIVSAANEDLAERTIYSSGVAGTPNVDLNPLKAKVSNLVVWSKVDNRTGGTDTSAYWFMADSKRVKKSLKAPFAQKPMMQEAEQVTETQNWLYPIDCYYTIGIGFPLFVWGSTGVN